MIKIKITNKVNCTKLSVFDFDNTLFKSPDAPKNYKGNWHASKESLDIPNIPKVPDDSFWNVNVVNKAKEEISDSKNCVILLTGRIDQFFEERIKQLIKQKNINFKHIWLNEFGRDTAEFKIEKIEEILKQNPTIKKIEMWEDEKEKAAIYKEKFGNMIKINLIAEGGLLSEEPHLEADQLPEDFLESLPDEVRDTINDMGVVDFAIERYPKIDSLKDKLTSYPKMFYIDSNNKTFLVDNTGDTTIVKVSQKKPGIQTLPSNWYDAYFYRLGMMDKIKKGN